MLAQNFKTAADLGITEPQADALRKTLVLLETGKLEHAPKAGDLQRGVGFAFSGKFNMNWWSRPTECGTVCCIGGTAELIGDVRFPGEYDRPPALQKLFHPGRAVRRIREKYGYDNITPDQAATALRSYLTTGDARWDLAIA